MSSRIDAQPDRVRRDGSGHVLFCTDTSLADHIGGLRCEALAPQGSHRHTRAPPAS